MLKSDLAELLAVRERIVGINTRVHLSEAEAALRQPDICKDERDPEGVGNVAGLPHPRLESE